MKHTLLSTAVLALCCQAAHAEPHATYSNNTLRVPNVYYNKQIGDVTFKFKAPDIFVLDSTKILSTMPNSPVVNVPEALTFNLGEVSVGGVMYRVDLAPVVKGTKPTIGTEFKATNILPSYQGKMFKGKAIIGLGVAADKGNTQANGISDDGKTIAGRSAIVVANPNLKFDDKAQPYALIRFSARFDVEKGSISILNALPDSTGATPLAANNLGVVVGYDGIKTLADTSATRSNGFYNKTGKELLNVGKLSQAREYRVLGINNKDISVGWSELTPGAGHTAFMYDGNTKTLSPLVADLLKGQLSFAFAINDSNQIVGSTTTTSDGNLAFIYKDGVAKTLGSLDNSGYSEARSINAKGEVTGFSATASGQIVAFYHNGTSMVKLPEITGQKASRGLDINASGHIVGSYVNSENLTRGFLYKDGKIADLRSLLPAEDQAKWASLGAAMGISDDGVIVGSGSYYVDDANKVSVSMGYRIKL